jgi:3-hydroxypropanoate dehydrogenase
MTTPITTNAGLVLAPEAQDLLFRQARTPNTFTGEPVSDERVQAIYDLVKYAPTSINSQPLRVLLLRTPSARGRLIPLMMEGNRAKTESGPLTAILAADTEFHEHLPKLVPYDPGVKAWFADPGHREHAAKFSATIQVGYFLLGIRAAGLGAGPMTGFDAAAVDREFFPQGRQRSLVVVNIGNPGPDAWLERLPRLEHDEVFTVL